MPTDRDRVGRDLAAAFTRAPPFQAPFETAGDPALGLAVAVSRPDRFLPGRRGGKPRRSYLAFSARDSSASATT